METTSIKKFIYRIEPNPAGGFIARPSDPSLAPIEGATREEVQQKIQAKIAEMIQGQLPLEIKLGPLNVKIDRKVTITTRSTATPDPADKQLSSTESLVAQNMSAATAPSSERISTILRVAAGLLALLAILYYVSQR